MPVSGLVISLRESPQRQSETLARIQHEPAITMGDLVGQRLAVVATTESREQDRRLWDWLHSLPGVMAVDVVFVGFDDPDSSSADHEDSARATPGHADSALGSPRPIDPLGTSSPNREFVTKVSSSDRKDVSHHGC